MPGNTTITTGITTGIPKAGMAIAETEVSRSLLVTGIRNMFAIVTTTGMTVTIQGDTDVTTTILGTITTTTADTMTTDAMITGVTMAVITGTGMTI